MNQIEKLIEELCPDGVEYKPLGSLGVRNKGIPITAKKMRDIADNTGDIKIFAGGKTSVQAQSTSIESKGIFYKPSIIVKSRGYIGFEYYDQPFTHKSELWSYSINENGNINQKFVFYYLTTKSPQLQEYARATSVKIPQLSVKDTDTLPIPIPPLVIQNEIVTILDTFQSLEAELEARKKQYEFYRDQLLTFYRERVRWVTLSEICSIKGRIGFRGYTKADIVPQGHGAISLSPANIKYSTLTLEHSTYISWEKYKESPEIQVQAGDILFCKTGSTLGKVTYLKEIESPATINPQMVLLKSPKCLPQYLAYSLQTASVQLQITKYKGLGSVPNISQTNLGRIRIPVPPLEEQQRIVNILDKFDALVNDLTSGLPAEIEARRKQYEFYRDQLLTFKELSA